MKTYRITINWNGFIGCSEDFIVDAETKEEAIELALDEARDCLSVEEAEEDDDEEW